MSPPVPIHLRPATLIPFLTHSLHSSQVSPSLSPNSDFDVSQNPNWVPASPWGFQLPRFTFFVPASFPGSVPVYTSTVLCPSLRSIIVCIVYICTAGLLYAPPSRACLRILTFVLLVSYSPGSHLFPHFAIAIVCRMVWNVLTLNLPPHPPLHNCAERSSSSPPPPHSRHAFLLPREIRKDGPPTKPEWRCCKLWPTSSSKDWKNWRDPAVVDCNAIFATVTRTRVLPVTSRGSLPMDKYSVLENQDRN